MVIADLQADKSIGEVNYDLTQKQIERRAFSGSLFVVEDIA